MKDISEKRKLRIENKKKKMAALIDISKLNEYDRLTKKNKLAKISETDLHKLEPEPSPKRLKTSPNSENSNLEIEAPPLLGELGPSGRPKLQGKEFLELKKMLRDKTTKIRNHPKFWLRDLGSNATIETDINNRVPLFLSDIQHLIMYSQIGPHSPYSPARWCGLEKYTKLLNVNILIVENVSLYHFIAHESLLPFLSSFEHKLEVITPSAYSSDIVKDLSMVPLTGSQMKRIIDKFGTLDSAVTKSDEVYDALKQVFPIESSIVESESLNTTGTCPLTDKYSRTQLLLSGWQMVEENFPLPIKGLMERKYRDYILTKDSYSDVTPFSPMFAVDCEMCKTSSGDLELTRVSIVDEKHETFYDTLVKPDNKIVDYLTRYSGITAKMMKPVIKKLVDVHNDLRKLLPKDAILIGQSLSNDMHALKMMHPYVIDTSVIYNLTGDRNRKTKLQTLTRHFLDERIQESRSGHCSTEDSLACMKLTQLKLKKSIYYGDSVMGSVSNEIRTHPQLATFKYATNMLKQCTKTDHSASVIGIEEVGSNYKFYVTKGVDVENKSITCISESSNDEVIKTLCEAQKKYNLNIGHIRILDSELEQDKDKTFSRVDTWAKDVCENSKMPSLNIVLLGGHKNTGNGVCFIKLKKEFVK